MTPARNVQAYQRSCQRCLRWSWWPARPTPTVNRRADRAIITSDKSRTGRCGVGTRGRIVAALLLVGLPAAGCTSPRRPPAAPSTTQAARAGLPDHQQTVVALLADNQLLKVATDDGTVLAHQRLGSDSRALASSHGMALSGDRRALYVLVPRGQDQPTTADRVEVLDPATLRVRASYRLDPATTYQSLALGRRSGRLYLFGNRPDGTGLAAVAATLDPADGRMLRRWTVRQARGRHWWVYRGVATSDERHLLVSYHGQDTTGADVLTLPEGRLVGCRASADPGTACLPSVHGDVIATGRHLLATTGDPSRVERLTLDGRVTGHWDSRLAGNHLMELALDPSGRWLYAVGACGYAGGLSAIDLSTGQVRVLARPTGPRQDTAPLPAVCGERVEAETGGLLAVAKTGRRVPASTSPRALLDVDARTGLLRRAVATPSEPVDLLLTTAP
jgi:hypothetical protein